MTINELNQYLWNCHWDNISDAMRRYPPYGIKGENKMNIAITNEVLSEVVNERINQDNKWGEQNHLPPFWLAILGEEFGEVCKAVFEHNYHSGGYRKELIHVAAVAVAMVECFDRNMKEIQQGKE